MHVDKIGQNGHQKRVEGNVYGGESASCLDVRFKPLSSSFIPTTLSSFKAFEMKIILGPKMKDAMR